MGAAAVADAAASTQDIISQEPVLVQENPGVSSAWIARGFGLPVLLGVLYAGILKAVRYVLYGFVLFVPMLIQVSTSHSMIL